MASDRIDIIQHVRVFAVETEGEEIRADIYGGDVGMCGSVVYRFSDNELRDEKAALLRRWASDGTPVTYLSRDGHVALLDEMALLTEALKT